MAMSLNTVERIDDSVRIKHVLASVSRKENLDVLVNGLVETCPGVVIYSTGGTYDAIRKMLGNKSDKMLVPVSEYTGQPEMQGGLVKTLDFKIYLGLLSETYNDAHQKDLARLSAIPIDMVVVNLYPFRETIAKAESTPENARANIDIGGPCMVRASAKNFIRVASVTNPLDYDNIVTELRKSHGKISLDTRFQLARKAFVHTADYDKAISDYLQSCDIKSIRNCYHM
jgi:phosphoribosylaminoimidazolecarboxamide formyltransferase / IMP cyclohydrolase